MDPGAEWRATHLEKTPMMLCWREQVSLGEVLELGFILVIFGVTWDLPYVFHFEVSHPKDFDYKVLLESMGVL